MSVIFKRNDAPRNHAAGVLKWTRRTAATILFILAVIFLAGAGSATALRLKWVAEIQIIPVALSVSLSLILFWIVATLIFGRIYCSTVCPMGYLQDIAARIPRLTRRARARHPYRHTPDRPRLRLTWLAFTIITVIAGTSLILALFDPYAAFGRIVSTLVRPILQAAAGENVIIGSTAGIVIAALTLLTIAGIATRSGRTFCNTLCPVGSALGIISRNSLFRIDINTDRCTKCHKCERACKARCIDLRDATVDMSRCVVCFDCISECDNDALRYTTRRYRLATPMMMKVGAPQTSAGMATPPAASRSDSNSAPSRRPIDRRRFLATGIIMASAPAIIAVEKKVKRFEAMTIRQTPTAGTRPVAPPGATSWRNFLRRCVGCGACVAACPGKTIRLSGKEYGLQHPLHPVLDFDNSYCRYNCTVCTEVCPTGAMNPLTPGEKRSTAIGLATVDADKCIGCGKCVQRCPRTAITMTRDGSRRSATVDPGSCIGCGSCQYICPATPARAITVNGLQR